MSPELFNPANYNFSPYAIPTLIAGVAILALGFIVLVGERDSRVSLSFFVMTVTAAIWLFCYSLMYCAVAAPNTFGPSASADGRHARDSDNCLATLNRSTFQSCW